MIRYLAFEVVRQLNNLPFKGGLSPHDSPWEVLYQQTLDYNKYCTIKFGAFLQANNDKKSDKLRYFADN